MNKLYLHNLKAEQNIQELRGELAEAEAERQSAGCQLTEADKQIRDLHGQLDQVAREQRDLSHELCLADSEGERFDLAAEEASRECEALAEMLRGAEAENASGSDMCRQASGLRARERERVDSAVQDITRQSRRLGNSAEEARVLEEELCQSLREGRGLRSELDLASCLGASESDRIASLRTLCAQQLERFQVADQECRELRRQVASLDQESRQASSNLEVAERLDRENCEYRDHLRTESEERIDMRTRLGHMENEAQHVDVEYQRSEKKSQQLQSRISELSDNQGKVHSLMVTAQQRNHSIGGQLSRLQKERKELEFTLKKARELWNMEERRLEKDEMMETEHSAAERAGFLRQQQKRDALRLELDDCETENGTLESECKEQEQENEELLKCNEEMDEQAAALRAQSGCGVS